MHRIELRTDRREQVVDVTREVSGVVAESGVGQGAAVVYCPHTTAGVTVNESADPNVARDILDGLRRLVPRDAGWRHAEGNADPHVKATLVGPSVTVPVADGRLALGTWQGVYFCEFDGPRTRSILVRILQA